MTIHVANLDALLAHLQVEGLVLTPPCDEMSHRLMEAEEKRKKEWAIAINRHEPTYVKRYANPC